MPPPRWRKGGLPAVHRRLTGGKRLLSPAMPPPPHRWRKGGLPAFHRRLTGGKNFLSPAMPPPLAGVRGVSLCFTDV